MPKIVITGGPCTGKTTLLQDLGRLGFGIVDETARRIIKEQQKVGGNILPWINPAEFEIAVKQLQLEGEEKLPEEKIHFLDRSLADILAYCDFAGIPHTEGVKELCQGRYHKVLLLEPLKITYEKDSVRKENKKDAKRIHRLIEKAYTQLGYEVIKVPVLPPKERMEWVLKQLGLEKPKSL